MNKTPVIHVGIQFTQIIEVSFSGEYKLENGEELSGKWKAVILNNKINLINSGDITIEPSSNLIFTPVDESCHFTLHDVTIGINFHWERNENQSFKGGLKLIIEDNKITAINICSIEDYLISVISSEMSATSSMELLKAHAVISRSWILAQIKKNKTITEERKAYTSTYQTENELIKWYDREDHLDFDVCADDHCQRYQGITRSTTQVVEEAVTLSVPSSAFIP